MMMRAFQYMIAPKLSGVEDHHPAQGLNSVGCVLARKPGARFATTHRQREASARDFDTVSLETWRKQNMPMHHSLMSGIQ